MPANRAEDLSKLSKLQARHCFVAVADWAWLFGSYANAMDAALIKTEIGNKRDSRFEIEDREPCSRFPFKIQHIPIFMRGAGQLISA